jgi:hypothetical protein
MLSDQQQTDLGLRPTPYENIPPSESTRDGYGSCLWADPPGPHAGASYGYTIRILLTGDPLAEAYLDSNSTDPVYSEPSWPVFITRTIRDLPAVVRTRTELTFACEIVIGTGNGQGLAIKGVHTPDDPSLCDRMVAMAELVVDAARR